MHKFLNFYPHHESYKQPDSFDDLYESVEQIIYPIEGHALPKVLIGSKQPRTCALCLKGYPEATFNNESHTVPTCLGNRHHISLEECDKCNERFGSTLEKDLSNWLLPTRTFGRIRGRTSYPKLHSPDGSTIEIDTRTGSLRVEIESKQIDLLKNTEAKSFEIEYIRPAFKPANAVRSILKTVWLLLPQQLRIENELILKLVNDQANFKFIEIWEIIIPGNGSGFVTFDVWKKRENKNTIESPGLVVRLCIGNKIIIWVKPDEVSGIQLPGPLPPIQLLKENEQTENKITANRYRYEAKHEATEKIESVTCSFETVINGPVELPTKTPAKYNQVDDIMTLSISGKDELSLKTKGYIRQSKAGGHTVFLNGLDLAARISIRSDGRNKNTLNAKISTEFSSYTTNAGVKTLNFFRFAFSPETKVTLTNTAKHELLSFSLEPTMYEEILRSVNLKYLSDLNLINEWFGMDIRYNYKAPEADLLEVKTLANILKKNGSMPESKTKGKLSTTISINDAKKIYNEAARLSFKVSELVTFKFLNNEINLERKSTISGIKFVSEISSSDLNSEDGSIALNLQFEIIKYDYVLPPKSLI